MIVLEKQTKIKLLKAIKTGQFDAEQFPELRQELHHIKIEVIRRADQVRKLEEMSDDQLDDKITDLEKKLN